MRLNLCYICFIFILNSVNVVIADYFLNLSCNNPVVQGAVLTCTAKLRSADNTEPEGIFEYIWRDDAFAPGHTWKITTNKTEVSWNITYPAPQYPVGIYKIKVIVNKCIIWNSICYTITSKRIDVSISSTLNGHMKIVQNNEAVQSNFIATKLPIVHEISLNEPDQDFLKKNATNIVTYWFVDCRYYGSSQNYSFNFKYNKTNEKHMIEALVVAGFDPITTPAPSTTSTTPTTSKPTTTTTTKPIMIKKSLIDNSTEVPPSLLVRKRRYVSNNTISKEGIKSNNNSLVKNGTFETDIPYPYVCSWNKNVSNAAPDPRKVYGYFSREFITNDPITNITVTGNNWLKKGDELYLKVKCDGSPPFSYCLNYYYNATLNITCSPDIPLKDDCQFDLEHYYSEPTEHNMLVIIQNHVTTYKAPVTVTVYKVETHSQLSVIVVPVSFSLVAVVLIVFGIAYYIQNQRRFTIEVANFDFSQQYSDMEYKTFKERLRDSVSNAFTRPHSETPEPSLWSGNRKYGNMT